MTLNLTYCEKIVDDDTTPTPWVYEEDNKNGLAFVSSAVGAPGGPGDIATFWLYNKRENAALTVQAVNAHDDLVTALKGLLAFDAAAYDRGSHRAKALIEAKKTAWRAIAKAESV